MDAKDLLKKYWFLMIIAILLIAFVISFAVQSTNTEKEKEEEILETKQVDNKYILFSVDGKDGISADEFYKQIDNDSISYLVLDELYGKLANKEIKSTERIKTLATNAAQQYIVNSTEEQLQQLMRSNGLKRYGNLTTYYEEAYKKQELLVQFFTDHYDDIMQPYFEENEVKGVSHILVKVADVSEETDAEGNTIHKANPTEEETEKLNKVLEALKTKSFEDVAIEFSEDGSAANGGFLAFNTTDEISQSYVKEFADCANSLEFNKQSDVITSQYGYHIILVEEPSKDNFGKDMNLLSTLANQDNGKNYLKMLNEYIEKYKVEIVDEDIKDLLNSINEVEEETTEESSDVETETDGE